MKQITKNYLISSSDSIVGVCTIDLHFLKENEKLFMKEGVKKAVSNIHKYYQYAFDGVEIKEFELIQNLTTGDKIIRFADGELQTLQISSIKNDYTLSKDLGGWPEKQVLVIIGPTDDQDIQDTELKKTLENIFAEYKHEPSCHIYEDGVVWCGHPSDYGGHVGYFLKSQELGQMLCDIKGVALYFSWG